MTGKYFNYKKIPTNDIELINADFGLSGYFGYIIRSKYIRYNTYTGRITYLRSKPTPIHVPVHKTE